MELLDRFDVWLANTNRSVNTREAYLRDVREYLKFSGHSTDSKKSVEDYILYLIQVMQRTGSTAKRAHAALCSYFDFLVATGSCDENVARCCSLPDCALSRFTIDTPDVSDVNCFMEYVHQFGDLRDTVLISLMCYTDASVSEVVSLSVGDIDLKNHTVRYGDRVVALHTELTECISDYIQELGTVNSTSPLFTGRGGQGLTRQGAWLICKRWSAQAGVMLSPRQLRRIQVSAGVCNAVNW